MSREDPGEHVGTVSGLDLEVLRMGKLISNREAQKEVQNIALDNNFAIPGDPGFPLNQVCAISLLSPSPLPSFLTDANRCSTHPHPAKKLKRCVRISRK